MNVNALMGILTIITLFICCPISLIIMIVLLVMKKKQWLISLICLVVSAVLSMGFIAIGVTYSIITDDNVTELASAQSESGEQLQNENENQVSSQQSQDQETITSEEQENIEQTQEDIENIDIEETVPANENINDSDMTMMAEEEYKENCQELFYDDVFFGDTDLTGEYLKLNLFVSEKYYFTKEDLYKDSIYTLYTDNNLYTDFYKCCVLRKDTDSYMGEQIDVLFTQDYDLVPDDYDCGMHIIAYGKVIYYSQNSWTGYNQLLFIPRYIEVLD